MTMLAAAALFGASCLAAQTVTIEVAAIKPHIFQDANGEGSHLNIKPGGRITASNVTVAKLIGNAFAVERSRIVGAPSWIDSQSYDFEVKTAGDVPVTRENIQSLLLSLLETRFALRYRTETKLISGYTLEVLKEGSKLQPHAGDTPPGMSTNSRAGLVSVNATGVSGRDLAQVLTRQLGVPVEDRTGLSGTFDFTVEWASAEATDSTAPSVFTALKSLGMKLTASKVLAPFVVVGGIEKASEN